MWWVRTSPRSHEAGLNWKLIHRDGRIRNKFQAPRSSVSCYRGVGGWWIAVVTCIEACAYRTKSYRFKRDALRDAKEKRKELEKMIDESVADASELDQGKKSHHG